MPKSRTLNLLKNHKHEKKNKLELKNLIEFILKSYQNIETIWEKNKVKKNTKKNAENMKAYRLAKQNTKISTATRY